LINETLSGSIVIVVIVVIIVADEDRPLRGKDDLAIVIIVIIIVVVRTTTATMAGPLAVWAPLGLVLARRIASAGIAMAVPLRDGFGRDCQRSRYKDRQRQQRFRDAKHRVLLQGLLQELECSVVPKP
jgi:hypothetical protein